jgi:hypothetical protein
MSDNNAALYEITNDLDRCINGVQSVLLKKDLPYREAVMVALEDLIYAKKHLLEGLVSEEVAH